MKKIPKMYGWSHFNKNKLQYMTQNLTPRTHLREKSAKSQEILRKAPAEGQKDRDRLLTLLKKIIHS